MRILCNELVGNIFESLRLFLEELGGDNRSKVFEWYDRVISELHDAGSEKEDLYSSFKEKFIASLPHFIGLSPTKTADIIESWFN